MIKDINYLRYQENEYLIKEYFDALFFFREKTVIDVLKGYCNLKGNAINDYMSCHFANEFLENDEEYFGEKGVAFYLDYPAVDEDCIVILTYEEFFEVVKQSYENYIRSNQNCKDEIQSLLICLRKNLKINI